MKSCLSSLYVLPFICNCVLVSSSVLTTLKTDGGLRIFKDAPNEFKDVPNEFEEALKRHSIDCHSDKRENPQGCSGSFFVRDERSDPDRGKERFYNGDGDRGSNRSPRTWKSPDIVIRFGRAGFKNLNREQKRGRNDLNFIRYGRGMQIYPDSVVTAICSNLLSNEDIQPYEARLLRFCNCLNNNDVDHRENLDFFEDRLGTKHD
ncbi:hypothetical protein HZU73_03998 [Apis mellifera caucasica]|uniref:FMRFamide n=1 Tax=Apis mellifera TaxID=7460 RepID=A0A8U0WRA8_APIME|nr:FMRFamide-related peptides-like precursor [Apis mellifera]ACI90290.1 FMRFamide [Apis mellifera]KAG6800607.1 hypothetical protein HZU73_03998 [Apis mellifera caucasica]KAG9433559.1 hypothetical protein HZU67_04109 [Apis mellifera carnica]|eukprot:NP_001233180.1 uncharacterized protein LOC100578542 precursor [Apis mellifera]